MTFLKGALDADRSFQGGSIMMVLYVPFGGSIFRCWPRPFRMAAARAAPRINPEVVNSPLSVFVCLISRSKSRAGIEKTRCALVDSYLVTSSNKTVE